MKHLAFLLVLLSVAAGCAAQQPQPLVAEQAASIDTSDPSWKPAEESGVVFDEQKFDAPKPGAKEKVRGSTFKSRLTLPGHQHPIGNVHAASE